MDLSNGSYIIQTQKSLVLQTQNNISQYRFKLNSDSALKFKFNFDKIFYCNESVIYVIRIE